MSTPLSQIIADGTLVDNRLHSVQGETFRAGTYGTPVHVKQGNGWNNPWSVWPLIQNTAVLDTRPGKLVFRMPEPEYEHNTEDAFIQLRGRDPNNFTLTTGNLIGCVRSGGYSLRVSSRFGDEFLRCIIADADGFVELPERGGSQKGSFDWLLIYFWLVKLRKAFRLGLPKGYETRTEDRTRVRGRLDPVDYVLDAHSAFYRCTYREHRYDNDATRLIARTLQHLDSHAFLQGTHSLSQSFQIATAGQRSPLHKLLETKSIRNPYYADYNPVITLSKQILRDELSDFGNQSQTSALFFDVSMLFEYFVRKLLRRTGAVFRAKDTRAWTIPSGLLNHYTRRNLVPDLVFELDGGIFVFDVKYKSFNFSHGVTRDDLFQLHTYIGQISNADTVRGCGLIYPLRESRWQAHDLEAARGIFSSTITQGGRVVPFHVAFLKIPEPAHVPSDRSPTDFRTAFRGSTTDFLCALVERLQHGPVTM